MNTLQKKTARWTPVNKVLLGALLLYGAIGLACITGDDGDDDDNNSSMTDNNTNTSDNNTSDNNTTTIDNNTTTTNNTTPESRTLAGNYPDGLELTAEGTAPHYIVEGNVRITGGELNIAPGTVIAFQTNTNLFVDSEASIVADASMGDPIQLIGTVETEGHWQGVWIGSKSTANTLNNVVFQHAGSTAWNVLGTNRKTALVVENGRIGVENVIFDTNDGYGLYVGSGDAELSSFAGNTFTNNVDADVSVLPSQVGMLDNASSLELPVYIRDGGTGVDQTFPNVTSSYEVQGDIDITSAVTIEAGATFRFATGRRVFIDSEASLVADGGDSGIVFEGTQQNAGHWQGVWIGSKSTANTLNNVTFRHAGSTAWNVLGTNRKTALVVENGQTSVTNSTFTDNDGYGIYVGSGDASLSDFTANIFTNNVDADVSVLPSQVGMLDNASSLELPVYIRDGGTGVDQTFPNVTSNYEVRGSIDINSAVEIEAGAQFVFAPDRSIVVRKAGSLVAEGTADAKIIFEGVTGVPRDWKGILYYSKSASNALTHVTIRHAGSSKWNFLGDNQRAALGVEDGTLALNDVTFEEINAQDFSLYVNGGETIVTVNNVSYGPGMTNFMP